MAELSQKDQLILHEFSVRYRAAFAKGHPTPELSVDTVKDAVRETTYFSLKRPKHGYF
jgi:hypothetical protein